jgi:hypothetical protein
MNRSDQYEMHTPAWFDPTDELQRIDEGDKDEDKEYVVPAYIEPSAFEDDGPQYDLRGYVMDYSPAEYADDYILSEDQHYKHNFIDLGEMACKAGKTTGDPVPPMDEWKMMPDNGQVILTTGKAQQEEWTQAMNEIEAIRGNLELIAAKYMADGETIQVL